jgi:hypothetical protein
MDPERELALLISHRRPIPGSDRGKVDLARGVVTQLSGYKPGFVGVKIDGSTTTVACETLDHWHADNATGDVVEILTIDDRSVVIGKVGRFRGVQRLPNPVTSVTIDVDAVETCRILNVQAAISIALSSATPPPAIPHDQMLIVELADNGVSHAITWSSDFIDTTTQRPTQTLGVAHSVISVLFFYESYSGKWRCMAVA